MEQLNTIVRAGLGPALAAPERGHGTPYQAMLSNALDFVERKTGLRGREATGRALRAGQPAAHDYFRYGLAKEIGSFLGRTQAGVKAVYLFEPEMEEGEVEPAPLSLTGSLDLIVWIDGDKKAIAPAVETLNAELLAGYQALIGPAAQAMRRWLAVEVIDDADVERRSGSGGLIASVHTRPTKVWSRFFIRLNAEYCGECLICSSVCPFDAIDITPGAGAAKIDLDRCQLCGLCYSACPAGAIESAYYDMASLVQDVRSGARASGLKTIALTCRGSTPTSDEIEAIAGGPAFAVCLPCVGRTSPDFVLKALSMGIEQIVVMPCQEHQCRFEDGSRVARNRVLLLRSLLQALHHNPNRLVFREAAAPLASVNESLCTGCGTCIGLCPYTAIRAESRNGNVLLLAHVNPDLCQGCGLCVVGCPSKAIELSRFGNMHLVSEIESALSRPADGRARILGFRCNWCTYGDADLPFERLHDSWENIEVVRVPCVGRIDPFHVVWSFLNGADGVFLGGCPNGDCRYIWGSDQADSRISRLKSLLQAAGLDPRRLRLERLKRSDPEAYADAIHSFALDIRSLAMPAIHGR